MDERSIIKLVIDSWDPMDLLSYAPNDEYDKEVADIENSLLLCKDVCSLMESIYRIFVDSFGSDNFTKSKTECKRIAERIVFAVNSSKER